MKINQALKSFNALNAKTKERVERKIYQGFIDILSNLQNRDLTEKQQKAIEEKLDELELFATTVGKRNHLNRKLITLSSFLNKEYAWVTAGHYASRGMALGLAFGVSLGLSIGTLFSTSIGIPMGMSIGTGSGLILGMIFGSLKDKQAEKQNRVLK